MADETGSWDAHLDDALINAEAALSTAQPQGFVECVELARAWLCVADGWSQRQRDELAYVTAAIEFEDEKT